MPKCLSVEAVYDDGTVMRIDGELAESVGGDFLPLPNGIFPRPMRTVTTVRGNHQVDKTGPGFLDHDDYLRVVDDAIGADVTYHHLGLLFMPDDAVGNMCAPGPLCDFRVTVEAVKVEV